MITADERTTTAYHEAAHATAHVVFDITRDYVTIEADEDRLGHVMVAREWEDEPSARKAITAALAGMAAELHLGQPHEIAEAHAEADIESALHVLECVSDPDGFTPALDVAKRFVAENWRAIERVAAELLRLERLLPEEVDYLVEGDVEGLRAMREWRFPERL